MALTMLAANNASTLLVSDISDVSTTLQVSTGTGNKFPSPVSGASYFKVTLTSLAAGRNKEIVHVTARSGDTLTIVRGQEGTTAMAWPSGSSVANLFTAGTFTNMAQAKDVQAVYDTLATSSGAAEVGALDDAGSPTTVQKALNLKMSIANLLGTGAGQGANGLKMIQPFTGAVGRLQSDFNAQFVSVKDGGAVEDGTTSCGSAFQTVISANSHVYIPAGDWIIDANILKSSGPLCLRGAGVGVTRLICTVTTGTVLKFTPQNGNDFFDFSGFTMVGAAPIANSVQAIHIDGSAQLTSTLYRGMQVTGEREKRRGVVHNIDYQPLDSSHGFGKGLRITSLLNFNIHSQSFYGPSGTFAAEAFAIDGQGVPVDIRAYDLYAYNVTRAFNMPDYVEALYIKECDFIGVTEGICSYYQSGRSVIPTSTISERSNGLKIGPMHTSFKGTQGFRLDGAAYAKIRSCLIFAQNDAQAQKAHIYLTNTNFATITDNMLVGDASVVTGNASFGIVGDVLTNSEVSGNQANGLLECVHLTDYSVTNAISDNYAFGFTSAVGVNIQGNNSVQNMLRNNRGVLASVVVTSPANSLIAATYASGYNVSLSSSAAGSSQNISVTVPANIFSSKPAIAMMTGVNGDGLIYEFVPSTSSATSLSFNVRRADSTAISAGTFGVLLFASSNVG